ncbi:hypothetical protein [Fibrobacter sp. UWP2]|jgi:hypothetical protein|uniref:hypothetical protein n=1 Tax=Fibrobacter sp. UWP2 TaxID=1896216 RepID=UPI00091D711F|nr:hypothetical protein [Fibrobacter sp. UWP2]SHJ02816.1 hypothetical protein SAMN05720471_11414 [Fibrobacter sp. UWP2]
MKKSFLWAGCLAASLSLIACGDDSSTSVDNTDKTDSKIVESSSSMGEDGSSGSDEDKSSSSVQDGDESSSSVDDNAPIRAATFDDLEKNMVLKGLFGTDIKLSAGAKKGFFTFWLPGEIQDSAWVAVQSDFANGKLKIGSSNAGVAYISGNGTIDSLKSMAHDGLTINFIVNQEGEEPELLYFVDKGDTNKVVTDRVKFSEDILSKAEDVTGKRLSCEVGDTTNVYSFFDDSFMLVRVVGKDTVNWIAGYFDIQRSKLLMLPKFRRESSSALYTMEVSSSFEMGPVVGTKNSCKDSKFEFKNLDVDKLATEWDASAGGKEWTMKLKSDETYEILVGVQPHLTGNWGVFGDYLFLSSKTCFDPDICKAVMGKVTDFDAEKGFTFTHTPSFIGEADPAPVEIPETWAAPKYE